MSRLHALRCLVTASFLAGCTATRSPSAMKEAQDSEGFYTKSLHYTGSGSSFHYFEQGVSLDRFWWVPGREPGITNAYRVRRKELALPNDLFFSHTTYSGEKDPRRVKVRITGGPPYQVERRVYGRVDWEKAREQIKVRTWDKDKGQWNDVPLPGTLLPPFQNAPPPVPPRP